MNKQNFQVYLLTFLLSLISIGGCNKFEEQVSPELVKSTSSFSKGLGFNELQEPADLLAFNEVVDEEYEHWGKWYYEHFKYYSDKTVDQYVSIEIKEKVLFLIDSLELAEQTVNGETRLEKYLSSNEVLVKNVANDFVAFKNAYSEASGNLNTFSQVWNWFREYEKTILENDESVKSKYHVLVMCSIMRNSAKLIHENIISEQVIAPYINKSESRADGCVFMIKWSCWSSVLLDLGIAVVDLAILGAAGTNPIGLIAAFKSLHGLSAFLKFLKSTIALFGSSCACTSSTPSSPSCIYPTSVAIHVLKDSCHNRQLLQAVGGNSNSPYIFILYNGRPAYQPMSPNNRYDSPIPFFQITPFDISQPVTVGVYQLCGGIEKGAVTTFSTNFNTEVFTAGTIGITGSTNTSVGQTNQYTFSGTWTANENNYLTASVTYHGVINSTFFDLINVKWVNSSLSQGQFGGGTASVSGRIYNRCSTPNTQASAYLSVTVN
jgi:hypothetical protein